MIKCKLLIPVGPGDSQFPVHALGPTVHRQQLLGSGLGFMLHFSSRITHSLETGQIKAGKIQWFWNGGVRKWISGRTGLEEPPGFVTELSGCEMWPSD